jgi:hypothetical protein
LQGSHLPLKRCVCESELVLLGLPSLRNSLLPREIIFEFAEADRIARTSGAIRSGSLQRIERAGLWNSPPRRFSPAFHNGQHGRGPPVPYRFGTPVLQLD